MKKLFITMLALCALFAIPQISLAQGGDAEMLKALMGTGAATTPAPTVRHPSGGGTPTPKVDYQAEMKKLQDQMAADKAAADKATAEMKATVDKLLGVQEKALEAEKQNNTPLILAIISLCLSGVILGLMFWMILIRNKVHAFGRLLATERRERETLENRIAALEGTSAATGTGP